MEGGQYSQAELFKCQPESDPGRPGKALEGHQQAGVIRVGKTVSKITEDSPGNRFYRY
jgi:hypothetical protein